MSRLALLVLSGIFGTRAGDGLAEIVDATHEGFLADGLVGELFPPASTQVAVIGQDLGQGSGQLDRLPERGGRYLFAFGLPLGELLSDAVGTVLEGEKMKVVEKKISYKLSQRNGTK